MVYFIVSDNGTVYNIDLANLIIANSYMLTGKYILFKVDYIAGTVVIIDHKK